MTPILLQALALEPGGRLLDVGCGAGAATLRAAEVLRAGGAAVGADISAALVDQATRRAATAGVANVSFQTADVQAAQLGGGPFTAAMSQFGVMFFDEPTAAFANIRAHLLPSARLCFTCWQAAEKNPWSFASLLTGILPPARPVAAGRSPTGPFTLADVDRVQLLLREAGFGQVDVTPHQSTVDVAEEAVFDDAELALMGVPPARMAEAHEVVENHLTQFREPSGLSRYPLAYLVVTARTRTG